MQAPLTLAVSQGLRAMLHLPVPTSVRYKPALWDTATARPGHVLAPCSAAPPPADVLVGVMSAYHNAVRRDAVRATWMRFRHPHMKFRVVFVLGACLPPSLPPRGPRREGVLVLTRNIEQNPTSYSTIAYPEAPTHGKATGRALPSQKPPGRWTDDFGISGFRALVSFYKCGGARFVRAKNWLSRTAVWALGMPARHRCHTHASGDCIALLVFCS